VKKLHYNSAIWIWVLLYKLALQTSEYYGPYIIQLCPTNIYSRLAITNNPLIPEYNDTLKYQKQPTLVLCFTSLNYRRQHSLDDTWQKLLVSFTTKTHVKKQACLLAQLAFGTIKTIFNKWLVFFVIFTEKYAENQIFWNEMLTKYMRMSTKLASSSSGV
jgi:hypothetical protein